MDTRAASETEAALSSGPAAVVVIEAVAPVPVVEVVGDLTSVISRFKLLIPQVLLVAFICPGLQIWSADFLGLLSSPNYINITVLAHKEFEFQHSRGRAVIAFKMSESASMF
jgi:hypothetical protein